MLPRNVRNLLVSSMLIFIKNFILCSVLCLIFLLAQYLSQPEASHPSSYSSNLVRDKGAKIEPSVGWLAVVVVVASTVWRPTPISPEKIVTSDILEILGCANMIRGTVDNKNDSKTRSMG